MILIKLIKILKNRTKSMTTGYYKLCGFAIIIFSIVGPKTALANDPLIVTTIKPFYNLTAAVLGEQPKNLKLLITNNNSPHDYQLKPSDRKLIEQADLIIWGGEELEFFLAKIIATTKKPHQILDLSHSPSLKRQLARSDHVHHDHRQGQRHLHASAKEINKKT